MHLQHDQGRIPWSPHLTWFHQDGPHQTRGHQELDRPIDVKAVQSFIGFCNFYQKFIPGFSNLAKPLLCYASRQTYVEVNDTYSEGGTHEETLRPQSKARVMNKRQEDTVTIRRIADS